MWLGTEQDIGKLYLKLQKRASSLSKKQFNEEDKEEIISEAVLRTIVYVRNHDSDNYGTLSVGRVLAMSNKLFKDALIDHAKKYSKFREAKNDDDKTLQDDEKWPAVEYVQPKRVENEQNGKVKVSYVDKTVRFHLCSYEQKSTDTPQQINAFKTVNEVINKQLVGITDKEAAEFVKLSLWQCNKGFTLTELAHQVGFLGRPVLERNTFISGVDFILEYYFSNLSLVLDKPKTIQIHSNPIDGCDNDTEESTGNENEPIFSILPDKKIAVERSAYLMEVYEILKAAFIEVHQQVKEPNMANFFYLRFWRLSEGLSQEELALEAGVDVKKARTYFGRFLVNINKVLKEKKSGIYIDFDAGEAGAQINYDFSTAEVEELFNHELELGELK